MRRPIPSVPVRGPLDAPASLAHVADLREQIRSLEAKGEREKAERIRKALHAHGFAA